MQACAQRSVDGIRHLRWCVSRWPQRLRLEWPGLAGGRRNAAARDLHIHRPDGRPASCLREQGVLPSGAD